MTAKSEVEVDVEALFTSVVLEDNPIVGLCPPEQIPELRYQNEYSAFLLLNSMKRKQLREQQRETFI